MTSPPHSEGTGARLRPAAAAPPPVLAVAAEDRPLRERAREVLDVPGTATGLLTVLALALLARQRLLQVPAPSRQARLGLAAVALAAGLAVSVLWELGEWAGHTYLDPAIFVSVTDTIGDVAAGGLGSAVAGWWLAAAARPAAAPGTGA